MHIEKKNKFYWAANFSCASGLEATSLENQFGIFRIPIFVKKVFKKMNAFFFRIHSFFNIISIFSNVETDSNFLLKNLTTTAEKTFLGKKPCDSHSTATLPPLVISKNSFFWKKNIYFERFELSH